MGTTGLENFVIYGGPQLYYERLKLAVDVLSKRGCQVEAFYRLCEQNTPADTVETLKRWRQEKIEAGYAAEGWKQAQATANEWAVLIREAWLKRLPCPIIPNGPVYAGILDMALRRAGLEGAAFVPAEPHEVAS